MQNRKTCTSLFPNLLQDYSNLGSMALTEPQSWEYTNKPVHLWSTDLQQGWQDNPIWGSQFNNDWSIMMKMYEKSTMESITLLTVKS